MKFKIEYRGHGVKFTPVYATTIKGAVQVARKKGWRTHDPSDPLNHCDMRPDQALIYERSGELWERVAVVTERGVNADDHQDRVTYKNAMEAIDTARKAIEATYATMAAINAVANKDYSNA